MMGYGITKYHGLIAEVAARLGQTGAETDQLLLTRWRVVRLSQYLLGAPGGESEVLASEALGVYARKGSDKDTDFLLRKAGKAVARESGAGSVLPAIAKEIEEAVEKRLAELQGHGDRMVSKAIALVSSLKERLRAPPGGALLAGIQHRLELVTRILEDEERPGKARKRAAAAVLYLEEVHDTVDDGLGYIGLLDDDYALRIVLRECGDYADDKILHWSERISALWDDLPFLRGVRLQREAGPVATTWLDRINSYVSYSHALEGGKAVPLVLVQPSVVCSPLHTIISMIGLLVLDGLTSSRSLVESLRIGQTYEIDGQFYAKFKGVLSGPVAPGWLRLEFRDGTVCRPASIVDRMVAVPGRRLSSAKAFSRVVSVNRAEPIQRFFDWDEAIGARSIDSRVILVSSRQRAMQLLGGVRSNGVSLIDDGLVKFAGMDPNPADLKAGLVIFVPTLGVARKVIDQGLLALVVVVDGYERLYRGRHELPFLVRRPSPPPIITWSATGYYPDKPPSWLPQHRRLEVGREELAYILELDGELDNLMAPGRTSLWEAATAVAAEKWGVARRPEESLVLEQVNAFLCAVRSSRSLPDYWKYHLFSSATTLRTLIGATAAFWSDIQEYAEDWGRGFREQWGELRSRAAEQLSPLAKAHERMLAAVSEISESRNTKGDALRRFLDENTGEDWRVVCDRPQQAKIVGRFAKRDGLRIEPFVLRDLGVCRACIIMGWQNRSFWQRLRAHTPKRVVALVDNREQELLVQLEDKYSRNGESLLAAVGHEAVEDSSMGSEKKEGTAERDVATAGQDYSNNVEQRVACVFVWVAGETEGKVLAKNSRVLVAVDGQAREKPAHRIVPEERVLLGPGGSKWSPADEFTQAVVSAIEAWHPELVSDAMEWRRGLQRIQEAQGWTCENLQTELENLGVYREIPTIEGWLKLQQAAPIGPRHIKKEIMAMWRLIGKSCRQDVSRVIGACRELRGMRASAGRALLRVWKGRDVEFGVPKSHLDEIVDELRQEVQAHVVDATSHGVVPEAMLGWWIDPELAGKFEIIKGRSVHFETDAETGEDD